jgi:hypothetical protein
MSPVTLAISNALIGVELELVDVSVSVPSQYGWQVRSMLTIGRCSSHERPSPSSEIGRPVISPASTVNVRERVESVGVHTRPMPFVVADALRSLSIRAAS